MDRVLVSRQPIYRADNSVLGYELLFRDSDTDRATFADGARATAQVLVNTLMEIGMDELVGRHRAFINFERTLLLGDYCESLPPERVVLEILETVEPDKELLKRLERLRAKGYRIALDDFDILANRFDVEVIGAAGRVEGIQDRGGSAQFDEAYGEIAPDETQSARN